MDGHEIIRVLGAFEASGLGDVLLDAAAMGIPRTVRAILDGTRARNLVA